MVGMTMIMMSMALKMRGNAGSRRIIAFSKKTKT